MSDSFTIHRRLVSLIQKGVQTLEQCPELSLVDRPQVEEEEVSVLVSNYPFPITKGCYLTIEREYASLLSREQQRTLQEVVAIVDVRNRGGFCHRRF